MHIPWQSIETRVVLERIGMGGGAREGGVEGGGGGGRSSPIVANKGMLTSSKGSSSFS